MKSAIEELLDGKLVKIDSLQPNETQKQLSRSISENDGKITAFLTSHPDIAEAYRKFKEQSEEYESENARDFYKAGFRNGFRLALDATDED